MIPEGAIFFKQIVTRHVFLHHCLVLMNLDHNVMPEVKYHRICHQRKSKRVCIFSTYDEDSVVQHYVLHCLSEIKRYGFEVIFVSTSEGINESDEKKVAEFSSNIVIRENEGHDFTSWKEGTKYISWDIAETILFLNDSIIFPLYDFADEMKTMVKSEIDFWGLIDSQSNGVFVNSFFWLFNRKITSSNWFREFCENIPVRKKQYYVEEYEAKILNIIRRKKLKYKTFINTKELYKKYNIKDVKMYTHYRLFWDILCDEFKSPFIKKNILMESNKEHLIFTRNIKSYLYKSGGFKIDLPPKRHKKKNIREIISTVNEWKDSKVSTEKVCIYGDCFISKLISFITGYKIISKYLVNKGRNGTCLNGKKIIDFKEKNTLPPYELMIIGSIMNYDNVKAQLKCDNINLDFISLESIFKDKIFLVENLSINFKYAIMFINTRKGAELSVNEKYQEIFNYILNDSINCKSFKTNSDIFYRIKYMDNVYQYI